MLHLSHRIDERQVQVGLLPLLLVREIEAGQGRRRRHNIEMRKRRVADERTHVQVTSGVEQHLDTGDAIGLREERTGEVALRVEVDEQNAFSSLLADRGEEPDGVRLADAPFKLMTVMTFASGREADFMRRA